MARPKNDKYKKPKTNEERMERKRLRRVRSCRLKVYTVPEQRVLDAYEAWAIVRQNPVLVRERKALGTDPDARFWLPVTFSAVSWPEVYWLDVVSLKVNGKVWDGLCVACDNNLICAIEGRGTDPKHECTAKHGDIIEIQRRPRRREATRQ